MTRTLLRPPDGTNGFRFAGGCGKPHEYDGEHAIDCPACVEHVRLMSPDDRISRPDLRTPLIPVGETQLEVDTMRRVEEAKRHAASWRLVEAEDEPETVDPQDDEKAALRARIAELEAAAAKAPATAKRAAAKA